MIVTRTVATHFGGTAPATGRISSQPGNRFDRTASHPYDMLSWPDWPRAGGGKTRRASKGSDARMSFVLVPALCLLLTPGLAALADSGPTSSAPLDLGYRQMYNLQFVDAHRTFHDWEQTHPDDPLGPTSDAAAYLFSEFDRLGVLQSQFFVDDAKLKKSQKLTPDPVARQAFQSALAKSDRISDSILARSPQNRDALFAKAMNQGLRADYTALIEKRYLASVSYVKSAAILAERLLSNDPTYYDAYLAPGVENYILGLNPAPVRWLFRLYGAQTNKTQGIQSLRVTAAKGHYLLPFARLLLAIAALRDKNRDQARDLLAGLARDYPNNDLYRTELAKLH